MAMILITHDMGVVAETADDIAVMYAGQIVEYATSLDLFDNPSIPTPRRSSARLPQLEGDETRSARAASPRSLAARPT